MNRSSDYSRWVPNLVDRLRRGHPVNDVAFDAMFFPMHLRRVSRLFWTPVSVARCAVELLELDPRMRVLDVGAGVGKLCIIGAAITGASFVGIEHRAQFVRVADEARERAELSNVRFVHGDFRDMDFEAFDAIYLYNPFAENRWPIEERLDNSVALGNEKFHDDVGAFEERLSTARTGVRVVTYHGFGGVLPRSYRQLHHVKQTSGYLDLWVKERA